MTTSNKTLTELLADVTSFKTKITDAYATRPIVKKADGTPAPIIDLPGFAETLRSTVERIKNTLESVEAKVSLNSIALKPSSPTASGNTGDFFVDAAYVYLCVSQNSWIRLVREQNWS